MYRVPTARRRAVLAVVVASAALAACSSSPRGLVKVRLSERECLARAMYFESNRSSDAGMLAVGTVVMNRVKSGRYGGSVCEVVGANRQFAPGVLSRPMTDSGAPRARRIADAVLSGRRHPGVQNAQFFHTAGYKFPYKNMRYVLVAGGNAFYDKTRAPKTWWGGEGRWGPPPAPTERIDGGPIMVANVETIPDREPAPRRISVPVETRIAAVAPPRRGGSAGGVPIYEELPSERGRNVQVAEIEPEQRPVSRYETAGRVRPAAIREDNGLRAEDRWRDQELAAEEGRRPAETREDWNERRDRTIESEPLPVIEPAPVPVYEPRPSRDIRVASRQPRAVVEAPRQRAVEADPAAMGWNTGPQPVRTERDESGANGVDEPAPSAAQDGYASAGPRSVEDARRVARGRSSGSDGYDTGQFGYR